MRNTKDSNIVLTSSQRGAMRIILTVLIASALVFLALPGRAQLSSATVNGTVKDSSGAVIPGAHLTIREIATKEERTTSSNSTGNYAFVDLDPGTYELEVSKAGFSTAHLNAVTIAVNQTATFNFTLNVGTTTQNVTVSAAAVQLETSVSNLGTVFSPTAVNNLPLNGRNFTQLLTLTPGSSRVNTTQNSNGIYGIWIGAFNFPAVDGQWNRSNLYLLDGIVDNELQFSEYAVPPIVDSIEEFKMQSHNDQSQFGGVLGGVVNMATKSGTNQFHGDIWEFLRNDAFDARNPLLTKKTPLKQSVYGATIGGPVIAPHYNGRNHLFFFGSYEGTSIHSAAQALYNVPTAAELNGDFSSVTTQLYNPYTTTPDPANPGKYLRSAFPGNNISSALDPNMVKLAKDIFPASVASVSGFNGVDTTPSETAQNNYSLRIDDEINQSNLVWARFSQVHATQNSSGGFAGLRNGNASNAQNWAVSYVHTFGTAATLQLEAGHAWQFYKTVSTFSSEPSTTIADSGFNRNFVCNYIGPLPCEVPIVAITGYLTGGNNYAGIEGTNIYQYKADYTRLMGRHMIGFGADLTPTSKNGVNQATPNLGFSSFQTSNLESSANTGDAMASFLIGAPSTAERRNLVKNIGGQSVTGYYFQDQWQLTPKLTINWGIRYDLLIQGQLESSPTLSQFTGAYNLRTGQYILTKEAATAPSCAVGAAAPCLPAATLPSNVIVANSNKLINNDYDNVQPRLGFAYHALPGTVIHLSYDRVYDIWSWTMQSVQNEGALWPSVGLQTANNLNSTTVSRSAEDPLNLGTASAVLPAATPFNQVAFFVAPYLKNPYSDQWLVGVQQQLGANTVWTINYVGSRTTRLPCCDYYNVALTPGPGTPQSRAPFPYITPTRYAQSNGSSNYNSLQVQLHRDFTDGLSYTANYTWSKVIDVACDGSLGLEGCFVRNPYDPALDRSVAGFDLPQMFTGTLLYRLPFGVGQRIQSSSRVVNWIAGGWQVNAITTLTSGTPFTVSYSGDRANTGNDDQAVDLVGDPHLSNQSKAEWFNTAAFQTPAQYTYGDAPRNLLRSQWFRDVDLSLFRTFNMEAVKTEFRAEAFNGLNMPVLGIPGGTLNSTTFGKVSSTASTARQIQFALKIYF